MKRIETRDLRTLVMVLKESYGSPCEMSEESPLELEVECGTYEASTKLKEDLKGQGFECSEVEPYIDKGPTDLPYLHFPFGVFITSEMKHEELKKFLNSGIYYLVEY